MKKVLIISFTDLESDPRVNRQILFLKDVYEVTAMGLKDAHIDGVNFISINAKTQSKLKKLRDAFILLSGQYEKYYWDNVFVKQCAEMSNKLFFDIIIANDIESLPVALKIANGAKVVFDAHEYAPKEFEDVLRWRILYKKYKTYLCKKYMPKAARCMTVCDGIAEKYKSDLGVTPIVLTNAPYYNNFNMSKANETPLRMVLHSGANPSRNLEKMIELMDLLDKRFCLDFMLVGSEKYINKLKKMSKNNGRIRFIPPVPMDEIIEKISNYDIGIYILEPNSFNNRMALPNKFFEFIQAGLAIAIGPSPEMAKIVNKYNCGVISEDFEPSSMAKMLNKIDAEKIREYKNNSHLAAKTLCAENNKKILLELLSEL